MRQILFRNHTREVPEVAYRTQSAYHRRDHVVRSGFGLLSVDTRLAVHRRRAYGTAG